ncbi:uncharacterized protein LOC143667831 [Tamandua tetradactyla]|uniref:uncharacterized protein LOC143667831 n=1 Tax=Tamandua tetradactyla TaxID=48850 RepID=UPI0040546388
MRLPIPCRRPARRGWRRPIRGALPCVPCGPGSRGRARHPLVAAGDGDGRRDVGRGGKRMGGGDGRGEMREKRRREASRAHGPASKGGPGQVQGRVPEYTPRSPRLSGRPQPRGKYAEPAEPPPASAPADWRSPESHSRAAGPAPPSSLRPRPRPRGLRSSRQPRRGRSLPWLGSTQGGPREGTPGALARRAAWRRAAAGTTELGARARRLLPDPRPDWPRSACSGPSRPGLGPSQVPPKSGWASARPDARLAGDDLALGQDKEAVGECSRLRPEQHGTGPESGADAHSAPRRPRLRPAPALRAQTRTHLALRAPGTQGEPCHNISGCKPKA